MKFTAIKSSASLIPTDQDAFSKVDSGDEVMCEYVKKRNPGNHRRAFAFFNYVLNCQEKFVSVDVLRKYLAIKAGYCDIIELNGECYQIPKSIAFDKIGEPEFKDVFSLMVDAAISEFGDIMSQEQIDHVCSF